MANNSLANQFGRAFGLPAEAVSGGGGLETATAPSVDFRAKLKPFGDSSSLFGTGAIMAPLRAQGAKGHELIFPFTPMVMAMSSANYDETSYAHSIYKTHSYSSSTVDDLTVTGDFVAQTPDEAAYLLAVMHFFRTATKSYFGAANPDAIRGAPPPIVKFEYLGKQMFNNVPTILKNYTYVLEPGVDYVPVTVDGETSYVPSYISITITLGVYYNPRKLKKDFSLSKFRNGDLLKDGYI